MIREAAAAAAAKRAELDRLEQEAREAAEEAARQEARDKAAAEVLEKVGSLETPDGKTPLADVRLTVEHDASGLVVVTDGDVFLTVQKDRVVVVEREGPRWVQKGEAADLAELGAVLGVKERDRAEQ